MMDVHQDSQTIVADLIHDKESNIGEQELAVLLDSWRTEPRAMVSHYVPAHNGSLSTEQLKKLPQGYQARYWKAFSSDLRALFEAFLAQQIGEVDFWSRRIAKASG